MYFVFLIGTYDTVFSCLQFYVRPDFTRWLGTVCEETRMILNLSFAQISFWNQQERKHHKDWPLPVFSLYWMISAVRCGCQEKKRWSWTVMKYHTGQRNLWDFLRSWVDPESFSLNAYVQIFATKMPYFNISRQKFHILIVSWQKEKEEKKTRKDKKNEEGERGRKRGREREQEKESERKRAREREQEKEKESKRETLSLSLFFLSLSLALAHFLPKFTTFSQNSPLSPIRDRRIAHIPLPCIKPISRKIQNQWKKIKLKSLISSKNTKFAESGIFGWYLGLFSH